MPVEQEDTRVEHDGDDSGSDLDPEDLALIDSRTTQSEVRVEGGSRTIMIPVNHNMLKDNKDVVNVLGPFSYEAEHETLWGLRDRTLSKSIVGLALQVCRPSSWRLRVCGERRKERISMRDCGLSTRSSVKSIRRLRSGFVRRAMRLP
uniref:Uncharacterized protein LOC104219823 isoform X2 n=1 Tax=Nicotiana sylvestris TaxID=4096 RepID=A0A1U7W2L2_NICSY|nr:PREDICTED: uncharacterized protein LOC104219823 isoform X2 [Nicotiana sylvestris]